MIKPDRESLAYKIAWVAGSITALLGGAIASGLVSI